MPRVAFARQVGETLFGRSVIFIKHNISKYGDLDTRMFAIPGSWIIPGTAHPIERDVVTLEIGSDHFLQIGSMLAHDASFPIDDGTSLRSFKCHVVISRTIKKCELFKALWVSDLKGRG